MNQERVAELKVNFERNYTGKRLKKIATNFGIKNLSKMSVDKIREQISEYMVRVGRDIPDEYKEPDKKKKVPTITKKDIVSWIKTKPSVNYYHKKMIEEMIELGIINKNHVDKVKSRYGMFEPSKEEIKIQEKEHYDRYYDRMWEPEFVPHPYHKRRPVEDPTCYQC